MRKRPIRADRTPNDYNGRYEPTKKEVSIDPPFIMLTFISLNENRDATRKPRLSVNELDNGENSLRGNRHFRVSPDRISANKKGPHPTPNQRNIGRSKLLEHFTPRSCKLSRVTKLK